MSWIKIDSTLAEKPQVRKMARLLKLDRRWVTGGLVAFWGWCDLHSADGTTMLTDKEVDELCGHKGFARALVAVGWLEEDESGELAVTDWEEHNGESAKKRALSAKRQERHKRNKSGNAEVTQEALPDSRGERQQMRYLEKEKENNKVVVGKATLDSGAASDDVAGATPAPPRSLVTDRAFLDWLKALCPAHPSLRQSRALAPDVMEGAMAAYERCPQAAQYGELLVAYFADRLQEDRHRKAFWRPTGQRKFFENLEDVISHAERWDKETGWSKKQARASKMPRESREDCPQRAFGGKVAQVPTEKEKADFCAFLSEISKESPQLT